MARSSWRQRGSQRAPTPALFARSPYARSLRCEALEDRRLLALLTVTTDQDVVDLNDGQTSLREAIFAANLVPGADEIQFDFGHDGPATILLTQGELRIEDSLTITGPGAEMLTIDASGIANVESSSIFNISDGKAATIIDVSIFGLTLTGARNSAIRNRENLTLNSIVLTGNKSVAGGALWMDSSSSAPLVGLNIIDTSFVDNTSTGPGGGAIYFQGYRDQIAIRDSQFLGNNAESTNRSRGGAISIQGLENQVEIVDTQIKNNTATEGGGVHVVRSGNVRIADCDISQNTAWAQGGGINAEGGILRIERSTIAENVAGNDLFSGTGGGLWFSGGVGEAVINESMISRNSATFRGGGIGGGSFVVINSTLSQNSSYDGGAIYGDNLRLLDSTVSSNSAEREGGGVFSGGIPTVTNSTIVENSAGYRGGGISAKGFELEGSVVAKNSAPIRPDVSHASLISSWIAASHSLIGFFNSQYLTEAPIGSPDANGNLIGGPIHGVIDPLLAPLANNGGPTLTHALLPGSPAINAGDPTLVAGVGDTLEFDQRGEPFRRVAGGRIDIGAFESQSLIVDTLVDETDGDFSAGDFSLREAIELANQIAGANTIEFSPSLTGGTISLTIRSLNILDAVEVVGLGQDELTITNVLTQGPIFNIDNQLPQSLIEVSLTGLTLTGSTNSAIRNTEDLTVDSLTIHDNSGASGGGIRVEIGGTARAAGAKLTVRNSTFTNNHSTAPSSSSQGGGAIYFTGFNGEVTVENSVFTNNQANTLGGGIYVVGLHTLVQIRDTTFDGNTAGQGGAVAMTDDITEAVAPAMFERLIVTNNSGTRGGGGIYVSGKGFEIRDSHIAGNQAGAAAGAGSGGGGISKFGGGTFIIRGTTISDNHSDGDGGGITLIGPWLTLLDSRVENNTAKNNGGGISILGGSTVELRRATISGNSTMANGGGLYARSGGGLRIRIFDSTVSDNLANESGGGSYLSAGTVDVMNTTVSGNEAYQSGGGFLLGRVVSQTSFRHNTITNNTADADQNGTGSGGGISAQNNVLINLDHTIVAGNFGPSVTAPDISGTVDSRYSLLGSGAEFLGPLANNGGPTLTHALLSESPAINAGDPALSLGMYGIEFDQRGEPFRRIAGGRIDIGALESQSLIVDTLVDEADGDYKAGDFSLREAVKLANQFPGFNTIEFAPHLARGTIYLIQGEIAISDAVEIVGLGADLLTIDASSSDLTPNLKVGDGSRVFNVTTQSQVSFAGMTITGGDAAGNGGGIAGSNFSLQGVNVVNNAAKGAGGGISGLRISVIDSIITGNLSTGGRGGGGIAAYAQLFVSHSTISNNDANIFQGAGGGIWAQRQVTIEHSLIDNNRTTGGSGGIRVEDASTVFVRHSTISNNVGNTFGGGIGVRDGLLQIENSQILGNGDENVDGGGVWSASGEIRISDSVISGNVARTGGGIFAGRILTVTRSTVSDNHAINWGTMVARGGGIYARDRATIRDSTISDNTAVAGGGVFAGTIRPLNIVNSTIEGNFAESSGGGIFAGQGQVTQSTISNNTAAMGAGLYVGSTTNRFYLSHNTITLNNARGIGGGVFSNGAPLEISNTIIAGNLGNNPDLAGVLGVNLSVFYSIIGTNAGNNLQRTLDTPDANSNLIGGTPGSQAINPQLGPLADNGGPTLTHALLSNSPAIDAGSSTHVIPGNSLPEFDQRGAPFARIANGRIDIGAYESQPAAGLLNGDFDGDGDVDGRDFLTWQRGAGTTPADKADGDATDNNVVDSNDLAVWQETYGRSYLMSLQADLNVAHEELDGLDFAPLVSEPIVDETIWDSAFDNWLPKSSPFDFGDFVTRRVPRRLSVNR